MGPSLSSQSDRAALAHSDSVSISTPFERDGRDPPGAIAIDYYIKTIRGQNKIRI